MTQREKSADRTVLHVDCNSFFASVETVFAPHLAGVPMAVAGDAEARHGIILAKNELAKKHGIVTAETVWSARKKCPSLVLVPPRHGEYARYSRMVRRIFERYTDLIEPFGIDEAWLDVTGSRALFGDGREIAERIRREVKEELGITVSVGVSFNKVFAKLGSDYKKPDAVTVIGREEVARIVFPLPVDSLLFVGKQTAVSLVACNIKTIGDLAMANPAFLKNKFGKAGEMLSRYARGEDDSPVASLYEKNEVKSVSNGMTFRHDLTTVDEVKIGLGSLSEEVAYRLRQKDLKCSTVAVTVKDTYLKSYSRQKPVSPATDLAKEIAAAALELIAADVSPSRPIRLLTVAAMGLLKDGEAVEQIGFFDEEKTLRRKRTEKLETALDAIRDRFGVGSVQTGAVLGNDIGIQPGQKGKENDD
ncbi:MAG: DNA polymerase IV [Clostridia bacterium]|nr:DNA polymerase IV [Clostridia bacterium]